MGQRSDGQRAMVKQSTINGQLCHSYFNGQRSNKYHLIDKICGVKAIHKDKVEAIQRAMVKQSMVNGHSCCLCILYMTK